MAGKTTRERIAEHLLEGELTAAALAVALDRPVEAIYRDLEHVARSYDGANADGQFLVAPPRCRECGFDRFDERLSEPSRCPECRSEAIDPPIFTIEER